MMTAIGVFETTISRVYGCDEYGIIQGMDRFFKRKGEAQ